MNEKLKRVFKRCKEFISKPIPDELVKYEESLNLDRDSYYGYDLKELKNEKNNRD